MDAPKSLPNQVKQAARLARRSRLADLNKRAGEVMAQLQREYEVQYGIRLTRLYQGPVFAQPAFEGAGKLPEALLGLMLGGKGTDPGMRKQARHALLIPLALEAIGVVGEEVDDRIWNRPQHPKKAERMRERVKEAGYTVDGTETTLGHFLKRIQAGRVSVSHVVDTAAPYWSDLNTLWYDGKRIRVTWRGEYPQCSRTKKSVWRMLGEYADTREKQRGLVASARSVQAKLDAEAAARKQQTADEKTLADLDIFDTYDLQPTLVDNIPF